MFVAAIPVSISLGTLIIELLIFLATVWLMERLVFAPIRQAWAERDRAIQEGLAASTDSRDFAEEARAEVQRILREARQQAQGEIDRATAEGSRTRDQLVAEATQEFRRLLEQARVQIGQETERAREALYGRIVDIALIAATRVSGQT